MIGSMRLKSSAIILAAALALAGCSTISNVGSTVGKLNPFASKKPQEASDASESQRISIVAFDQKVEANENLKGQDFFLPAAAAQADWPVPGGNAEQSVENVDAAPAFQVAWRRGFGKGSGRSLHVTSPPVMADGRIYVMDAEATVVAIDARSGGVLWKTNLKPKSKRDKMGFGGGVAYADGKLYVASGFRFVAQLDAATGKLGWKTATESPIHGAPNVSGGRVFVISTDNELLVYDITSGNSIWDYQALIEPARILGASSPAVSGDAVVGAFASGELVALRTSNGNQLWNTTLAKASRSNALSEIRDVAGRPVIYKGDVYAASHSGVFAATDLRSGNARWTLAVASTDTPWPAGDVVFVTSTAGEVVCASRETGQVYWVRDLNQGLKKKKRAIWTGPILVNDRLILVSDKGQAIALDPKSGVTKASLKVGASVLIAPIAANGMIYLVNDKAELVAIR
ncbi:MAG: dehydrogenase [Caulobacter sp.]|nr:dehydrogenase [Caulobacter sp.]